MKVLLVTLVCTVWSDFIASQIVPLSMPCNTSTDCPSGYCCVSFAQPGGKRQVMTSRGSCQELGQVSDFCYTSVSLESRQFMYVTCPCNTGLVCRGSGNFDMQLGEYGTCTEVK